MAESGFESVIATGGISTGLEVAKAIALGATAAGIARPVLQALVSEGREGAIRFLDGVERELRAAMLLVGARSLDALRAAPRVIVGELSTWLAHTAGGGISG
jgi:isopentenyl-diphosphate delta-isomerase